MAEDRYEPVVVSRRIGAPSEELFALLAYPVNHPSIDGTGMLQGLPSDAEAGRLQGVGDTFRMRMRNPDFGNYEMTSHVVEYLPGRRIAWEPTMTDAENEKVRENVGTRLGYRWTWELEPMDDGTTLVTETYDCSKSPQWLRDAIKDGEVWRQGMEGSLGRLEALTAPGDVE